MSDLGVDWVSVGNVGNVGRVASVAGASLDVVSWAGVRDVHWGSLSSWSLVHLVFLLVDVGGLLARRGVLEDDLRFAAGLDFLDDYVWGQFDDDGLVDGFWLDDVGFVAVLVLWDG